MGVVTHALATQWTEKFARGEAEQVGVFVNKPRTEVTNPFNMQSEFIALQGAIHDFTNLKQEFEKIRSTWLKWDSSNRMK